MSEQPKLYKKEQAENQVEINEKDYNVLDIGCSDMPFPMTLKLEKGADLKKMHYVGVDKKEAKLKEGERLVMGKRQSR